MAHELRIQRKRWKGWKAPENAVYVGRPTAFGNPFKVAEVDGKWFVSSMPHNLFIECRDIEEAKAVALRHYRAFLEGDSRLPRPWGVEIVARAKKELRGKQLACWCPLDQPCHADILAELANA